MIIKTVNGKSPEFGKDIYIADNATIVGDVITGDHCSIWFNAVIRADVNSIRLGNKVNVQDGVVIHCTYQRYATHIGNNVSLGHNAIVHGCTIEDNVLIGMGSIVMDGCVVGQNSIVAAGAVVTQNTHIEPGSVYAGIPAKKIKDIDENLSKQEVERIANNYLKYASWFKEDQNN